MNKKLCRPQKVTFRFKDLTTIRKALKFERRKRRKALEEIEPKGNKNQLLFIWIPMGIP